ncbi:uncharacterized protein N7503_001359 [Penicillium pulvis]|uniref:uncharacterized protein n=1 Tax=Penicillium pulvis TaxID=1562058 RepID=UPI0025485FAE|nr:uncharacterized protein N7503_001359 [Penicillium pulvis]KAJ5809141.1 hypothetical protein N7503_001359 [Penicillium pulvis]
MYKIDFHHHFYPPNFTKALKKSGGDPSGWYIPEWSLEADQKLGNAIGNGTTILFMTAPGACIEKDVVAAAHLARASNEYAAAIRDAHPKYYGFFVLLPSLLDTKASLDEIAYSLDILGTDRVLLFTRYGIDNHYLGHPDLKPTWEELNRRQVVVFVHLTHAFDTNPVNSHLPQSMFNYPQETGRTAMLINRSAALLPHTPMDIGLSTEEILGEAL